MYARKRMLFRLSLVLLGIASSVLSFLRLLSAVVITAAAATALLSWIEARAEHRTADRRSSLLRL